MTARFSREYGAHLHVAQEARRVGYGDNVTTDGVGVRQPSERYPLFGPPTLTAAVYERDVLRVVLVALRLHPRVAWVERMNSGKFKLPGKDGREQWVRFGFKGMADVTGQLRDGRRLEVECKRPGEQPTPDQAAFLANVTTAGGVAFVAWGVDDVMRELGAA